MRTRLDEIVLDCGDPQELSRFWALLLDGEPVRRSADWSYVDPPDLPRLAFQRVPESKTVKNRVHLDLLADDIPAATAEAVRLGATAVGEVVTTPYGRFQVLADPEGNEFCFVSGH
ncbi:VOC family protein [Streptomyces minutiscleroticus]|uniref:Glyoxalase n=1 Tax=Streptomyces minutiscleroticus TaxID=68238 RepID=A0A918ND22_9ACTN|nr:VOC family protein [Streptomyces minutiscleroticus]GGX58595.1 glyoxalase [Streptomyces minutiscleroticus]